MRFAVLGPLAVGCGDDEISLSAPVHRILVALLLLHANKPVAVDSLAEAVWDEVQPPTAKASLQNHVMRLRRVLGPAGGRVQTRAPGYLMEVREGELDLERFTRLRESGRAAARTGSWADAARLLREALDQWTGEPISNVRSSLAVGAQAHRLAELRLQTVELQLEAELRCGHYADAIGELRSLATIHPLRERFRELLMTALYQDGRQAEALTAYRDVRAMLVDEYGIEPGSRIQRLHQRMLAGDPSLAGQYLTEMASAAGGAAGGAADADHVVPRQLPPAAASFVGRQAELARLSRWLGQASHAAGAPMIMVICGAAGVGKTTLAVHWAHRLSVLFPGGGLYLDLRGFAPAGQPADVGEAVRCLLETLGVAAEMIPASVQAQVGLYRSVLADRERMLVLLDNARDAEQVRPLLPAAPGSLAIVTSRRELAGLAAVDGAEILVLDVLTAAEASELLASRLGAESVAAESVTVTELSSLCARLPLALAVAAARAALPSGPTLDRLVAELRDARSRLDALDTGDRASSVRAVLSWSYRCLDSPAARMFRLLSLWHGPDIGVSAAASLAGVPLAQARRLLIELTRVQLLTRSPAGRFGCHDLLRAYAAERADEEEDETSRRMALGRLLDHFLHTGAIASVLLSPAREPLALAPPGDGITVERLAGGEQAAAWFRAEYESLLAAVFLASSAGLRSVVWQLAWVLTEFMERRGSWTDWAKVERAALDAARDLGVTAAVARANKALGRALINLGSRADAYAHTIAAQAAYREIEDPAGEARVTLDLAFLAERDGNDVKALHHAEHALGLFAKIGHRGGLGRALNVVGWYYARTGESQRGIGACEDAVALCAELGDQMGEAAAWDSLGYCHRQLRNYRDAVACCDRAIELTGHVGDRYHQADALVHLGDTHQAAADLAAARAAWQRALLLLDELRHPDADEVRRRLAAVIQ